MEDKWEMKGKGFSCYMHVPSCSILLGQKLHFREFIKSHNNHSFDPWPHGLIKPFEFLIYPRS